MRSNIRNLTIVGVCVVVLGGALAALKLTGNDTGSASSSSSGASIQLVSKKSEDVVSMKVTNQKGSYTLLPMKTASTDLKNASSAPADSTVNYTVQELGGCPVDTTATSTTVQDGFSLVASKDLGTVSDLDQYGLKNPQATVDVSFKDGSTFSYKIGKPSATDASSYYMCGTKSDTVYVVAADQGLFQEARYFASKTVTSIGGAAGQQQQQQNDFTKLTFTGAAYPQPVTVEDVNKVMMITSPERCLTDYSALTAAQGQLSSLTANGIAAVNPDAAALKKYGFDKPTAAAAFTVNKGSYKLTVGAKSSTGYYVMLDGVNAVYDVSADSVSGWISAGFFGLRSKNVVSPTIDDVSGMTITAGSDVCKLNVARTKDTAKSTQDKTYYNYAVTQNGKAVNYNKAYINFFENLAAIAILEDAKTVPSGTPALTVEYSYFSKPKDVIQYIPSGDRRYTAVLNGKAFGIVTQDDLDTIRSNVKQLEAGGDVH